MSNELIKTINKQDGIDAILDLSEAVLDTQISDELLSNIPLFGVLVKLKNFGYSLSDYFFIKKLQKFVFQLDSVSKIERRDFFKKFLKILFIRLKLTITYFYCLMHLMILKNHL